MVLSELKRLSMRAYVFEIRDGKDEPAAMRAARAKWPDFYPDGLPHDIRRLAHEYAERLRDRK